MNPWTHTCLSPSSKISDAQKLSCPSRPDVAPVTKALRLARGKCCQRGLQQVPGHSLCHRTLSGDRHAADDNRV